MVNLLYTVTATLPDRATAEEYVEWLRDGHVDAVVRGGAHAAMIVRVEEPAEPIRVQTCYTFAGREAYERYVREHAPALRADGLRRFGPERGIRFERSLGLIV